MGTNREVPWEREKRGGTLPRIKGTRWPLPWPACCDPRTKARGDRAVLLTLVLSDPPCSARGSHYLYETRGALDASRASERRLGDITSIEEGRGSWRELEDS